MLLLLVLLLGDIELVVVGGGGDGIDFLLLLLFPCPARTREVTILLTVLLARPFLTTDFGLCYW